MIAIKHALKRLANFVGFDIRRGVRGWSSKYLAQISAPKTVIDVGVGFGTTDLYAAYPDALFLLIEPLRDYEPYLQRIAGHYNCKIIYSAVGRSLGKQEIMVDPMVLQKSSFHQRSALTATDSILERRIINVTTLDDIYRDIPDMPEPILLKLDTEGHELDVIRGAKKLLERVDTVIAEVSVAARFSGGYRFEGLVSEMAACGFSVFDFLSVAYMENKPGAIHTDVVFRKQR